MRKSCVQYMWISSYLKKKKINYILEQGHYSKPCRWSYCQIYQSDLRIKWHQRLSAYLVLEQCKEMDERERKRSFTVCELWMQLEKCLLSSSSSALVARMPWVQIPGLPEMPLTSKHSGLFLPHLFATRDKKLLPNVNVKWLCAHLAQTAGTDLCFNTSVLHIRAHTKADRASWEERV